MNAEAPDLQAQTQAEQARQAAPEVAAAIGSVAAGEIHPGEEDRLPDTPETHQRAIAEGYKREKEAQGLKFVMNSRQGHSIDGFLDKHGRENVVIAKAFKSDEAGGDHLRTHNSVWLRESPDKHKAA